MPAQTTDDILREFGRAYVWMLPGILLSLLLDGIHNGGLSFGAVLTFAGAAKSFGLHPEMSLIRLVLHRGFDFIGKIVFYFGGLVLIGAVFAVAVDALIGSDDVGIFVGFAGAVALSVWPIYRGWPVLSMPFVTPEFFGGETLFNKLWVSPGLLYAFDMTRARVAGRFGPPVLVSIYGVLLVYFLAVPGLSDVALPVPAGAVLLFALVPVTIFVLVRQGHLAFERAWRFAQAFDRWDGDFDAVPPDDLLRIAIRTDVVEWLEIAAERGARLRPHHVINAASAGSLRMLQHFPEGAIGDRIINDDGENILHAAARNGHVDVIVWALSKGLNPDAADGRGRAPLHHACRQAHLDVAEALLDAGAAIDPENGLGQTPLVEVVGAGRREMVLFLIERGADTAHARRDRHGRLESPLKRAVHAGHPEIMRDILESSATFDPESDEAAELLSDAAMNGRIEAVRLLLEFGVDPAAEHNGVRAIDIAGMMQSDRYSESRQQVIELLASRADL